jgi:cardiolipin synthase
MTYLHWVLSAAIIVLMVVTAGHALLYKREPRAAWAWIVTCVMLPPVGPVLYFLLGINRVRTKAKKLQWRWPLLDIELLDYSRLEQPDADGPVISESRMESRFSQIAQISSALTRRPLLRGNTVNILHNGEQAYPGMLQAIHTARQKIFLSTYIFESNRVGREFIKALADASSRGVDVRVVLDGVGEYYSLPRAGRIMQREDIPLARFLPPKLNPPSPFINLRNHRKLLISDGGAGFTGGMNIGDRHLAYNIDNPRRIQDVHFRLTGPIVAQMEQVFLEDWGFCTGQYDLQPGPIAGETGDSVCRTITVGPNQDLNKLSMIMVGAISLAQERISIMTPYFLPNRELIGALQTAALRGIRVEVVLPARNNLPYVHWATRNMLWELLQYGIRVYFQPPPFAHTKLFLVDGFYGHIGSANLDPRSLRLNFEIVVEIYDRDFVQAMSRHVDDTVAVSTETTLQEMDARPVLERARDSVCWLFSPYL